MSCHIKNEINPKLDVTKSTSPLLMAVYKQIILTITPT